MKLSSANSGPRHRPRGQPKRAEPIRPARSRADRMAYMAQVVRRLPEQPVLQLTFATGEQEPPETPPLF